MEWNGIGKLIFTKEVSKIILKSHNFDFPSFTRYCSKKALAISRGGDSSNLFLSYEKDGVIGWGEAAPGKNENAGSVEEIQSQLNILIAKGIENKQLKRLIK